MLLLNFQLYSLFLDSAERENLSKRYDGQGLRYGDIKQELFERTMDYFKPYREQRDALSTNPTKVYEILHYGAEKAKIVACEVLERVRSSVGLKYKPWVIDSSNQCGGAKKGGCSKIW